MIPPSINIVDVDKENARRSAMDKLPSIYSTLENASKRNKPHLKGFGVPNNNKSSDSGGKRRVTPSLDEIRNRLMDNNNRRCISNPVLHNANSRKCSNEAQVMIHKLNNRVQARSSNTNYQSALPSTTSFNNLSSLHTLSNPSMTTKRMTATI